MAFGRNKGKVKAGKARVIPSLSLLSQVRRVHEDCIEDLSGRRYAVLSVPGYDSAKVHVTSGWALLLNSIEYPVQVLVRQHRPDLTELRRKYLELRPEGMRSGRINAVGNSLIDYLAGLGEKGRVVARCWYVVAAAERAAELTSALSQSGFDGRRLGDAELGLLLQAGVSGMGYGFVRDDYQVKESSRFLELNRRYMAVYEVEKWPRRISLLFLERLLNGGDELDLSFWLWPATQRESHTRLQMQRSRFEGSRLVSMQKGKLVPPEVELAIADVIRISDSVERGVSKLFRRSLTIAVYGSTQQELREAGERLSGHFRSNLAKVNLLRLRQGRGFAAMMPTLRGAVSWTELTDSDTLVRMFPFGPPSLDSRDGPLLGLDLRSRTPVIQNPFSPAAMNGHLVVMARSGAGKSYFTKVRVVREALLDTRTYLIDPEGEYGVITRSLGGRVFVPGSPGHGLNPFFIGYTGSEKDLTERIATLGSLIGVMLEGHVDPHRKAIIDRCLTGFYARELERAEGSRPVLGRGGIQDFHRFLESERARDWGARNWPTCSLPSPPARPGICSKAVPTTCWRTRRRSPAST